MLLTKRISKQLHAVKNNPLTSLLIAAVAVITIYIGYRHHTLKQSIVYLSVMWLFSLMIDFYAINKTKNQHFEVRQAKRESIYFFICVLLGFVFLTIRFSGLVDWEHLHKFLKLLTIPLIIFVFPIGLGIIMLLLKFKPKDLGFRFQGLLLIFPIIIISALVNQILFPQRLTLDAVLSESGGIVGLIFTGFIVAGLSEEFFRLVGQTRLGAYFNNAGIGWFLTTLIWALMHCPKWFGEDPNIIEALLSSIRIIPIGLMWGYLTHRTKSIMPSIIVHGTNVWGLQNF